MKRNPTRTVGQVLEAPIGETKMRTLLLTGAAVLALSQAVMAETPNTAAASNSQQTQHMRTNLRNMLEKSGYTEIRVAPTSFMIHAKDNDGNPVVMSVSPDQFTEVTDINSSGNTSTSGSANAMPASRQFVAVAATDDLSSKVVGLDIYNSDQKDIGQIKDVAMAQNGRTQAYIVSVGGFLGVGEHYVAVSPQAVKVTYNDTDKKWHASMNATADQLKAAPEFKYTGRWEASKT
jgi:sporulation protein YlmC with PRC-barrel domain